MEPALIVSVSGIRGLIGQTLTAEAALQFGSALGTHLGGGRLVLGRDGRPSGQLLRHAVLAGLLEAGCEVHDLGVAATPTVGFAVRRLQAAGGIQITASHNPAPWNGLKLFGADGRILSPAIGKQVAAGFESRTFQRQPWNAIGQLRECIQANGWHQERVLELIEAAPIRAARFRVFLDANGGAGGPLARSLLDAFGTIAICQGAEADGHFAHEPEPTEANLREVCASIPKNQADIGLALDPDSDRLALIDETGRYIGEELTLALAVQQRLGEQSGPIVANMSTSRLVEDIARRSGCVCHRSAVGEAHVADKMIEVNATIGGEGNGGVIDPRVGFVRDPFIGLGLILTMMARTGKKLSQLVAELPAYHIVKDKYTVPRERLTAALEALQRRWPEARPNTLDGLRLDWEDRWIHVRPSNTEPIVRVIAEARDEQTAKGMCATAGELFA